MVILIADDTAEIRLILSTYLKKWGYEVMIARNGIEAWDVIQKEDINFVISDWMMPGMDGPSLCRKIRNSCFPYYIYIIMLTAKDQKTDLVEGMEAGADDFIVKPFNKEELKVRIKAGERLLRLEKELEEHNKKLRETNEELHKAYSIIKSDLDAAAKMQRELLPHRDLTLCGIKFDWLFEPSAFLAGDMFNFFKIDENTVVFYLLDVSGHGIPAAMLSVTLSHNLSPSDSRGLLRHYMSEPPCYEILSPSSVVRELNRAYQNDTMQYFTMIYGTIDVCKRKLLLTQAGHPSPIYISSDGETSLIGTGGFPVGMFPDADYEEHEISLNSGDRLFIYSDGITDCENKEHKAYSQRRLVNLLKSLHTIPLKEIMKKIEEVLFSWKDRAFEDDISLMALELL